MKCPQCSSEVRPSKKYPGYYLCDVCKKRYPASSVIDDREEIASASYDYYDTPKNIKSGPKPRPARSSRTAPRKKRKKKGNPLKMIIIVLLIVAAVVVVSTLLGKARSKDKKSENTDTGKSTSVSQVDKENGSKGDGDKNTYGVGEPADYNDVQIQLLDYEASTGNEWAVPADGLTFVFAKLEITNSSDKEMNISSMTSFDTYCGDKKLDYSSDAFTALSTDPDKQQLDGNIAGGEKLLGYLCFEVPANWTSIEIHFADNIWQDSNIKFVITQ